MINQIRWEKLPNDQRLRIIENNESNFINGIASEVLVTSTAAILYPAESWRAHALHQRILNKRINIGLNQEVANGTLTMQTPDKRLVLAFSASSGSLQEVEKIIDQITPSLNEQLKRRKIDAIPVRTLNL